MLKKLNKKANDNVKVIELNTDLKFSKCNDSKTKRSSIKTTDKVGGKKESKKNLDSDLKIVYFHLKQWRVKVKERKKTKNE